MSKDELLYRITKIHVENRGYDSKYLRSDFVRSIDSNGEPIGYRAVGQEILDLIMKNKELLDEISCY